MFLWLASVLILLVGLYWTKRWRSAKSASGRYISYTLLSLLFAILVVLVFLDRMDRTYMKDDIPVLIAFATDVSLSMGVMPDPRNHPDVGSRMDRVRKVLLPILNGLEASNARAMLSVTGFTARPEIILGWDNNIPQVREVVEYIISPGLLTDPGTDFGAALKGVVTLFDNLPDEYQEQENKQYLIVVSDGEQTLERADIATALADLRAKGISIIALHTGLSDIPEGLPVYDEVGEFIGFEDVGGQIYSYSDEKIMRLITGNEDEAGLYVRAEASNAVELVSDFIGIHISSAATSNPFYLASLIMLWILAFAVLLKFT